MLELMQDQRYVQNGKLTPDGLAELKKRMPFADFTDIEANPSVDQAKKDPDKTLAKVKELQAKAKAEDKK